MLPWYFKVTDITLTENRSKNKFFSKVHNCKCITSGKCVALILQCHKYHFNWKQKQEQVLFKKDHHCQCITSGRCLLPYTSMSQISLKLKTETRTSSFQKVITNSVSPVENVLPWYFKVTDVTLTENRNKNKFFSKIYNCQCYTGGKCVALIL